MPYWDFRRSINSMQILAGLRYHISSYGLWGFAMMSSPSLRAAVELGQRLLSLSFAFVRLELLEGPDAVELRVDADDIPEGARQFLLERDLVAARQLLNELCASPIPLLSVEDVAARLGYAEASSFIIAFRRWKGTTPRRFVQQTHVVECVSLDRHSC